MKTFARTWPLFALVASWDAVTTVIGTVGLLATGGLVTIAFGFLVGLAIAITLLFTFEILSENESVLRDWPQLHKMLKAFWLICLLYNALTAYFGNALVLGSNLWDPKQAVVLLGSTVILSLSTIVASFLFYWMRHHTSN